MNEKNQLLLMPRPKRVDFAEGMLEMGDRGYLYIASEDAQEVLGPALRIKSALAGYWEINCSPVARSSAKVIVNCEPGACRHPQGYMLDISPDAATLVASTPEGVHNGAGTLRQLVAQYGSNIPCMHIEDEPDFEVRGVMLDVSRDKVPTMQTLVDLVDILADWKINHIELYTEHTFAYLGHDDVWANASPFTGEEIVALDDFCQRRFIELVPNQNSFGHMDRWLAHDKYRHLAECPDGGVFPDGRKMETPFTICPTDEGSIALVASLYDQLLPHFTSRMFNVGCDETFDLGQGRSKDVCERYGLGSVYLEYLLKIQEAVQKHGRKMLFWGDIVINHPELIERLPKDVVALEWGYEADHPFSEDCAKFAEAGLEFWVCPGTSSWNSIAGRTDNAVKNLENAAVNGKAAGACGYLITDWGDNGHWQYLPVSYLGFLYGASCAWNVDNTGREHVSESLSLHAFEDATGNMGKAAYDLGNAYNAIKHNMHNQSLLWKQLSAPLDDTSPVENVTREELMEAMERLEAAMKTMEQADMKRPDADVVKAEFANLVLMLFVGCMAGMIRLQKLLGEEVAVDMDEVRGTIDKIKESHEKLWHVRNRHGGFADSVKRFDTLLENV